MILKLLDSEKAKVFGVPEQDIKEDDLIALLIVKNSWTDDSARKHIASAIDSGVFAWLEKTEDLDAVQTFEDSTRS